jgi:hypothetical protein
MNSEVLNSWKEIAAYMGRGVRTVQRWERELGLPVRRPRGKERSAVIALTTDLDRWLHKVPQGTLNSHPSTNEKREKLHLSTERLRVQIHKMVVESQRMQETAKATVILTTKLREQQAQRKRERLLISEPRTIVLGKTTELSSRVAGAGTTEAHLNSGQTLNSVQTQKGSANSAR